MKTIYISHCCYSLKGKDTTEENYDFNLSANSMDELVAKVQKVYEDKYLNHDMQLDTTPLSIPRDSISWNWKVTMHFSSAFLFGPHCNYDIYCNAYEIPE